MFDSDETSLSDHSFDLKMKYGIDISKQSLQERFNEASVKFIKHLLELQLANQITKNTDMIELSHFKKVLIKDSTRFQVHESLKEYYPGSSGGASGAGIHIQLEYDLISGKTTDLNVTNALRQDQTDARESMGKVEEGDLIIRDLGYFSTSILSQINEKKAYYISRLQPVMNIYKKTGQAFEAINLESLKNKMKRYGIPCQEVEAYIGKEKMPVRVIIELLPEEAVAKRLANRLKDKKDKKKKNKSLSKAYKARAALNIFITNAPSEKLSMQHVRKLYSLRWQIELKFKAWKSFFKLHKFKKMNKHRFECYLYGSLLHLMINWEIARNLFYVTRKKENRILSLLKLLKLMKQESQRLRKGILESFEVLEDYLKNLYSLSKEKLLVEERKGREKTAEKIMLIFDKQHIIC